jgi:predicted Zn-dependent protease
VRSAAFNAAMAPNGMMLVNTGFLVRTRNEAQLATVLGHEIGHYVRRHGVQAMRDARDLSGFAAVFGVVPYGVGLVVQIAAAGSFYAFSRDHEREADSIGMRLLDKAGYDPFEVPKIWEYLEREDKARTETEERSAFSATHPPQAERKEMLEQRAKATLEANPGPRTTGADRFHEIMLPRRGEYIRDILRIAQYGRAEIMIDALIEDGVNVAELRYFKGEVYRLRAKKGDREKAIAAYREALAEPDCPPEANRALGQVLLAAGDKAEASVAFRTYLEAKPNAPDREMVLLLMR